MKLNSREFESATPLGGSVNSIHISHHSISYSLKTQERSFDLDPNGVLDLIKYLVFNCMDSSERKSFLSLLPDLPAANNSTRETASIHNPKHDPLFFSMSESWHKKLSMPQRQLMMVWEQLSRYNLNPIEYLLPHAIDELARIMEIFMNHKETAEPQAKAVHARIDPADLTRPSEIDRSSPMVINTTELLFEEFMQAPRVEALGEQSRNIMIEYFRSVDNGGMPSAWPNQWMFRACQRLIRRFGEQPLRELLGFVITD